jgi:hypothetical protein
MSQSQRATHQADGFKSCNNLVTIENFVTVNKNLKNNAAIVL